MKDAKIRQDAQDDHVFVEIQCPKRPTTSIDVSSPHGRRIINISVDGMGIFSALLDLKELKPVRGEIKRYCAICGEKLVLHSSRPHQCKSEDGGL